MKIIKNLLKLIEEKDVIIPIENWNHCLRLLIGITPEKIKEKYKDFEDIDFSKYTLGKYLITTDGDCYLWIKNKPKNIEDLSTLQHEIFHITVWILHHKGVKFDIYNHESYSYLNGYLTKKIYEQL